MNLQLKQWLESMKYLPPFMRDFHAQKNLFRAIHELYQDSPNAEKMPNWIDGHCYIIDWFLWFMASRGYTLQKTRANQEFRPLPEWGKSIDKGPG